MRPRLTRDGRDIAIAACCKALGQDKATVLSLAAAMDGGLLALYEMVWNEQKEHDHNKLELSARPVSESANGIGVPGN